MADTVIFEDGDDLNEANLGQFFGQPILSDYVVRGVSSSIDFGTNTVDYTQGEVVVTDSNDRAYLLSADARSGLSLTDSATNHVFVEYDPTTDDAITFTINTTGTSPTDPHIKIEEIDTSADTSTELNRGAASGSTQADTGTITASGGSTPAADTTATNVSISQDSDYWVILYVDTDPSFSADYQFNWEYSHNWDDTNSEVDLDFTVNWDTDPGAGNDVTMRWEVRQP